MVTSLQVTDEALVPPGRFYTIAVRVWNHEPEIALDVGFVTNEFDSAAFRAQCMWVAFQRLEKNLEAKLEEEKEG